MVRMIQTVVRTTQPWASQQEFTRIATERYGPGLRLEWEDGPNEVRISLRSTDDELLFRSRIPHDFTADTTLESYWEVALFDLTRALQ